MAVSPTQPNRTERDAPRRGNVSSHRRTRRAFISTSAAGLLAGAVTSPLSAQRAPDARAGTLLIKGGTILTMDQSIGDFAAADLLIDRGRIAEIKPNIAARVETIDARGMIVIPGLVDAHRHCWQAVFRRAIADADFQAYSDFANALIPVIRPHDVYVAHLLSDLGALNAGITSLLDYSHVTKTTDIADAAIRGHMESGVRAVYAYAAPRLAMPSPFPGDLHRIRQQFFATPDHLVTLRLGSALDPALFALARREGVGIHCDGIYGMRTNFRPDSTPVLIEMANTGVLGSDVTLIHGTGFSDDLARVLAQHRVGLALAPTSDASLRGLADSVTPIQRVLDAGMIDRSGLSTDVESSLSGDLFTQMRTAFLVQRIFANKRWAEGDDAPAPVSVRDILRMATAGGAAANGLADQIGTLAPGKSADVLLVQTNDVAVGPLNNAAAAIVIGGSPDLVDTVIVGGVIRKQHGRLVRPDAAKILADARASRDYLARASRVWNPARVLA